MIKKEYLESTTILDFENKSVEQLIMQHGWLDLAPKQQIIQIYQFVRDDIRFGYNENDDISASQVLKDGYGQCNTKSNLLMALLRGAGIGCRFHGFTINKALQKGAFSPFWFNFVPQNIIHSWVEVYYQGHWYDLEGVILDKPYLAALKDKYKQQAKNFCGYGVYTQNLTLVNVDWNENNTYIQKPGINNDYGVFDNPDLFYRQYQQQTNWLTAWLFKHVIRHSNNKIVERIRG